MMRSIYHSAMLVPFLITLVPAQEEEILVLFPPDESSTAEEVWLGMPKETFTELSDRFFLARFMVLSPGTMSVTALSSVELTESQWSSVKMTWSDRDLDLNRWTEMLGPERCLSGAQDRNQTDNTHLAMGVSGMQPGPYEAVAEFIFWTGETHSMDPNTTCIRAPFTSKLWRASKTWNVVEAESTETAAAATSTATASPFPLPSSASKLFSEWKRLLSVVILVMATLVWTPT